MVSTKGRYALRVMLDLAEHADEGYIPLKDIALRQEVSKKYLEIIVRDLVAGKLIRGSSGKGGGYRLCRRPQDYTVGEIIELTEGTLAPIACLAADAGKADQLVVAPGDEPAVAVDQRQAELFFKLCDAFADCRL